MILYDFIQLADNRTRFNVYATNPFSTHGNRKKALCKNLKRWEIKGEVLDYIISSYQPYDFSVDVWVYDKDDYERFKSDWENGIRD